MPRKIIHFEEDQLRALELLSRNRMKSFQELADEAFSNLKNYDVPITLKEALSKSAKRPPNKRAAMILRRA